MVTSNVSAGREHSQSSYYAPAEEPSGASRLWNRVALLAILVLGLALRLWNLAQNEWGNEYYTAGVRSMLISWHNFLYNSFDPAGFVSVDKPPLALWIQAASAKLFGFHSISLFIPQVLEGVAAIWIIYYLVRRRFGVWAGLLAGLFLAVTPVSVAIDRSNTTDSCLVLVLLLAAWALTRAAEEGSRRLLVLSLALIGLAFNVKMLAAFVVLPGFVLVYYLAAPIVPRRRIADLAIAGVVLVIVSLSWVLFYDLTPRENRPFAGTTKKNAMLELAIGPYAVGRFVPPVKVSETAQSGLKSQQASVAGIQQTRGADAQVGSKPSSPWARLFVRAPTGPLRLADGQLAGQVGWLAPLAVMGLVLAALGGGFSRPLAAEHSALLLWFCWVAAYGVVYSFAGGIMHLYYLATMAPPLAALAGIGVVSLWDRYLQKGWAAVLLPATLLLTAAWQLYVEASALDWKLDKALSPIVALIAFKGGSSDWLPSLHVALLAGSLIAAGGLFVILRREVWTATSRALAACALGIGLLALLVIPMAWMLSSVLVPGHGVVPSADLARLLPNDGHAGPRFPGGLTRFIDDSKLVRFLKANRQGERYLLAASSARLAAPVIITTGEAVMAMGGFHGLDPILTPEKLAQMVEGGQIRFVMLGDLPVISRRLGAEAAGRPIAEWVRAHGKPVDSTLWRTYSSGRGSVSLYDLRPEVALVPAPSQ